MKAWLSDHRVAYTLRNVLEDPEAAAEFIGQGYLLPPVVVVDGEAVPGYQPDRLEALLEEE